jgi:hypothetical protein
MTDPPRQINWGAFGHLECRYLTSSGDSLLLSASFPGRLWQTMVRAEPTSQTSCRCCRWDRVGSTASTLPSVVDEENRRRVDSGTRQPVGAADSKIKATATGGRRYTCSSLAGHKRRQSTLVDDPARRFRPSPLLNILTYTQCIAANAVRKSPVFGLCVVIRQNVQSKDAATDSHQRIAAAHFGRTRSLRCHHRRFPLQTDVRWQQMAVAMVYPLPGK